ncbi:MAG: TerC/Alx family metal homeostasis membrane protein [Acidipila sp.]|nr:TerC/Alx family metal homeostasis membrane protein [Acidipila sp.]
MAPLTLWIGFHLLVLALLALDLGFFHRRAKAITPRNAAVTSALWVLLALAFDAGIFFRMGAQHALDFFTGYVIEYALSLDNIFVIAVLFRYFRVPDSSQHRVLVWGVLGALVMRGSLVAAGAVLLQRFSWALFLLGLFLIYTGIHMFFHKPEAMDPEKNPLLRWARRILPLTSDYRGNSFFVRENGRRLATPLLLVVLAVEVTDAAFALDSVPAIFAITRDPFIVYTSNVFAVLGLRALYFLLAALLPHFRYLSHGLAVVLIFVGTKMLVEKWVSISTPVSLLAIAVILAASLLASRIIPPTSIPEG